MVALVVQEVGVDGFEIGIKINQVTDESRVRWMLGGGGGGGGFASVSVWSSLVRVEMDSSSLEMRS